MTEATVRLTIPASSGYLVLARTAIAAMCARLDYPIDRLEDVKLAIDEACSLILKAAVSGESIDLEITPEDGGHLVIVVSGRTNHARPPKHTSFAWTVLTALVEDVEASCDDDGLMTVRLRATKGSDDDPSAVGV